MVYDSYNVLLLHLSAVFDTVDHNNLFEKYAGICGNALKLI